MDEGSGGLCGWVTRCVADIGGDIDGAFREVLELGGGESDGPGTTCADGSCVVIAADSDGDGATISAGGGAGDDQ